MNFNPTSEQALFQDSIRRTLANAGEGAAGRDFRATLADLGVLAVQFDEELGGLGGTPVETMLIMREFGQALVAEPYVSSTILAGTLLSRLGVGQDLVDGLIEGRALTILASMEAEARGDVEFVSMAAACSGDKYLINGRKSVVVGAPEADFFLVTARAADGSFPGIGLFRIDHSDHLKLESYQTIDGLSAADLSFENYPVAVEALLAKDCAEALSEATDMAIMAICAEAVGAMDAAFRLTNEYLKTRRQFGVPIGTFQALQHRMADRYVDLEQARSMLYRGTAMLGAPALERTKAVSAAKALIGRLGKTLGADMVQLHGGIGVSEEHMIGRYLKRLMAIETRFGNSDYHLGRFAKL